MIQLTIIASQETICQGQYGSDYQSWLLMDEDNNLIFCLNDSHHEQYIQLSIKTDKVPIILSKPQEDYSGNDIIQIGYISSPIDNADPDALYQKVYSEIQEEKQDNKILNKDQKTYLTYYDYEQ